MNYPVLRRPVEKQTRHLRGMLQLFNDSLVLSSALTSEGVGELLIASSDLNIQADLGTGSYELTNLSGLLFVDSLGVAASFSGGMALTGIPDVGFALNGADVEFNTRGRHSPKFSRIPSILSVLPITLKSMLLEPPSLWPTTPSAETSSSASIPAVD